ncbi:MAG: MalM family protein [Thermodesulfobacteriota bacterium]|nr:MalM family protein [Thermodesulfobacteriota bacterium]
MDFFHRTYLIPFILPAIIVSSGCQLQTAMDSGSPIYTSIPESAAPSANELKRKDSFLAALDKVDYQELDTENNEFITIDSTAQAIPFKTGKSYVKGIVLPDDLSRATLRIEAIAGKTVFVPTILVLKQNFRPSRVIDSSAFSYHPSGILNPDRLQATFEIDRTRGSETAAEKYLLIFTTSKDMQGSTQLQSPAEQYARARSLADPRLPTPVARHAATGLLRISALDVKTMAAAAPTWGDFSGDDSIIESPVQEPVRRPAEISMDANPARQSGPADADLSTMFPETEEMYNRLIRKSVDAGDIDKAWRLVQEGEKAGSVTVRRTFMRALDRKK